MTKTLNISMLCANLSQKLRVMKITAFLLLLGISLANANNYAQTTVLSLNVENKTVREVFNEIERNSEYIFLYNDNAININRKVSLTANSLTIDKILDKLFSGTANTYTIDDRQIYIARKATTPVAAPQQNPGWQLTGTVVDNFGDPVIGANILIKGTTTGVITDIDGHFTLQVESGVILAISYVGYLPQEVKITNQTSLKIALIEDTNMLDELVIVGYGTQRRGSVTGAVASVDNKDIIKAPSPNLSNNLGGRLPGLRVMTRSGEPGWNDSDIDIRGFGSALVIVDGVPGSFSQLDPNEIENITILKDASAAVYGIQAANGVILVTTKKGTEGATRVNFNATLSWQRPTIFPKMANAAEFVELTDEDKINQGHDALYGPEELAKWRAGGPGYESTDWYDEIVKPWAPQQQYNVNIRGGKEDLKYFASVGYVDQTGMWKTNSNTFERFNFRTNVEAKIAHGLSTNINLSGRKEKRNSPKESAGNIINSIQRNYPTYSPYVNGNKDYYAETNVSHLNPILITDPSTSGYYKGETMVFDGSASLNYDASQFVKGLSAKVLYHFRYAGIEEKTFNKKFNVYKYDEANQEYYVSYVGNDPSNLKMKHENKQDKIFQGSINYNNTFAGKHDVSALFLVETRQYRNTWFEAYREYIIDSIDELKTGVNDNKTNDGTSGRSGNIGYIGRLNYGYDNKYLVEFSFRYDGSSKFPSNSRWGFFPSVSAGWRISEEAFIKDKVDFLSDLKIRGSWGRLGDDASSDGFQFLTGYNFPDGSYIFGDKIIPTLTSRGLANPNITWYTSDLYNVGIDFTLWNGLLGGELDVFYRKRSGLPATRVATLPGTFGASLPQENLNSDNDRGFEIALRHYNRLSNGIEYSARANVSYTRSRNEYLERAESVNPYSNWRDNNTDRWKNIYWGYRATGQFQSYEEIANAPVQDNSGNTTLKPGDIRYLDYNGDGVIDSKDEHIIGRGENPEIIFGLDLAMAWKGFDVSVFLQGAANYNTYFDSELQSPLFNASNSYQAFTDRWHRKDLYDSNSEWIPGKYPSTYASGLKSNRETSSFWLENGSYLRIKDIQVGYTLPKTVLRNAGVENLRVFVSGYNLFTFTKLSLLDPEAPKGRGQFYPQQKVISVGLNLTL